MTKLESCEKLENIRKDLLNMLQYEDALLWIDLSYIASLVDDYKQDVRIERLK